MSNHVTEWLNAYLDGELTGRRLHQVEEHLVECKACQTELDALQGLSELLHEVPAPEFTSVEGFAAQVSLRLPRRQAVTPRSRIFEIGWWMIPVGLLAIWGFISTVFALNNVLAVASNLGLLSSPSAWMRFVSSGMADWSVTLAQLGILSGNSLNIAVTTEIFTRISFLEMSLQASIALLYLSWIAIWWVRHTRQQPSQLLQS